MLSEKRAGWLLDLNGYNFGNCGYLFPLSAFLNHSEIPNCEIRFDNDYAYMFAIQKINKGKKNKVRL